MDFAAISTLQYSQPSLDIFGAFFWTYKVNDSNR